MYNRGSEMTKIEIVKEIDRLSEMLRVSEIEKVQHKYLELIRQKLSNLTNKLED